MAKHGKCRVLVQGGVALEQSRSPIATTSGFLSIEVGSQSVWKALAQTPKEEWPQRASEAPAPARRIGRPPNTDIEEVAPEDSDPRDVPLRKLSRVLRWALDNLSWKERQREILTAIWFDSDVGKVCQLMGVDEGYAHNLVRRAKSEVIRYARLREWTDEFERTRLNPKNWPTVVSFPLGVISIRVLPIRELDTQPLDFVSESFPQEEQCLS